MHVVDVVGVDNVVVAHEELVVMHVVDVVGVDNVVLVGAGQGEEALLGSAHVSTAGVDGTELLLGEGGASLAAVAGGDLDDAGTLLDGALEAGTSGLAGAGLGAGAP